jgi:glycosyltransferase involved in cell wall biosynthesis
MIARRLEIAFVADTLFEPIGGGVIAGRHFVEKLRERHHVVVLGADACGPDGVPLPGFQLPLRAMRTMRFVMAFPDRAKIARAVANVDVVHLQFPFWLSLATLDEARRAGRKVVAGFHVQPENALTNVGVRSARARRFVYSYFVEHLYDRVDAVVCPTRFAERKLREHGLRTRTFVVSNGVPPDIGAAPVAPRERADDGFLLLAVGRLGAEKRHDVLLEAVARSRHRARIRVVICGAGPRDELLRRLARRLGVRADVGYVPRDELRRLLFTADLFVHPSEVELEGVSVLEAMSAGLPVLVASSPESAAAELALDDRFRFPAGDAGALATRIDGLLADPAELAGARRAYLERARGFELSASVDSLVRVYHTVLASDATRAA